MVIKNNKKNNIKNILLLLSIFAIGFATGGYYFRAIGNLPPKDTNFTPLFQAWEQIKGKFYGYNPALEQQMLQGAIRGIIESLNDPHSIFLDAKEFSQFKEELSGKYEGIGAEITLKDDELIVVSPLKGTPAEVAGILPRDKILEINNEKTKGMTLIEAVMKIKGKAGTTVNLKIQRGEEIFNVSIVRQKIEIPTLDFKMLDDDIAYVQVYNFYEGTSFKFKNIAEEILKSGTNKIIFDVRNNAGGFLSSAVDIGGFFISKDRIILKQDFGQGKIEDIKSEGPGSFANFKVIVLINQGSASASEILAGAIRESNKNSQIIGEKSFGKGSVQELLTLGDKSAIKLTVAHWLLPSGKYIEGKGIAPDIEIKMTEDDKNKGKDPQLKKARELLR